MTPRKSGLAQQKRLRPARKVRMQSTNSQFFSKNWHIISNKHIFGTCEAGQYDEARDFQVHHAENPTKAHP